MLTAEQRNHAKAFLQKAEEYVESAEDNFDLPRRISFLLFRSSSHNALPRIMSR